MEKSKLPAILKKYNVDRVIGYHELPSDKDGKILFGWQEKNDLPLGEKLVLSRQFGSTTLEQGHTAPLSGDGKPDIIVLAAKADYLIYFEHLVGVSPAEYISKSDKLKSDFKINNAFILDIALFLTTGEKFTWDSKVEYLLLPEVIT